MQYIQMSNVKNQQRRDLATMRPGTTTVKRSMDEDVYAAMPVMRVFC